MIEGREITAEDSKKMRRFYEEEPIIVGDRKPCKKCGKDHMMGVTDRETNTHTLMDVCYECFWEGAFKIAPSDVHLMLNDGSGPEEWKKILQDQEKSLVFELT